MSNTTGKYLGESVVFHSSLLKCAADDHLEPRLGRRSTAYRHRKAVNAKRSASTKESVEKKSSMRLNFLLSIPTMDLPRMCARRVTRSRAAFVCVEIIGAKTI